MDQTVFTQGEPVPIPVAPVAQTTTPAALRITQHPSHGSVTLADDLIVYHPAPGFVGADRFVYEHCDPTGTSTHRIAVNVVDPTAATSLSAQTEVHRGIPVRGLLESGMWMLLALYRSGRR